MAILSCMLSGASDWALGRCSTSGSNSFLLEALLCERGLTMPLLWWLNPWFWVGLRPTLGIDLGIGGGNNCLDWPVGNHGFLLEEISLSRGRTCLFSFEVLTFNLASLAFISVLKAFWLKAMPESGLRVLGELPEEPERDADDFGTFRWFLDAAVVFRRNPGPGRLPLAAPPSLGCCHWEAGGWGAENFSRAVLNGTWDSSEQLEEPESSFRERWNRSPGLHTGSDVTPGFTSS